MCGSIDQEAQLAKILATHLLLPGLPVWVATKYSTKATRAMVRRSLQYFSDSITQSHLKLERWRLGSTGTALGTRAHRLACSLSPRYLLMSL